MSSPNLRPYAWLAIAAALLTLALKTGAYFLTHSVGMLSDALESIVNVAAATMALAMLTIAARPADDDHAFGHTKAEYFSSGVEGALIFLAAIAIIYTAIPRLLHPQPLAQVDLGLMIAILASAINFGVALILLKAGKRYHSITLEADAHHLLTDVWTSVGILLGIGAVVWTGWYVLDPLIAIAVALNIIWTGWQLLRRSVDGLMDVALSEPELDTIKTILSTYEQQYGVHYNALKTRQAGSKKFISFHLLVNGAWSVEQAHALQDQLETAIEAQILGSHVLSHVEPIDAPSTHHY
ncbi:cation diffusion facilitator family transporter [Agitococcus lubricus]|uniref:Cation diffusion facilitator family transporter n=1 Tax=Agitococcus lubricus TaxID=1077255 RepID=A0A2T5J3D1_9GAMM|nr:cation diffusion facilitator family transporter [Agitococcus lubricus]PTQ91086.1 cation diffusion facilitator family transporter [Agitococcus lubricus]